MCSTTPRFSYRGSETGVTRYEHGSGTVCQRVGVYQGGYTGGYTGWVLPGLYPVPTQHAARGGPRSRQRSGPRKALQGPGVGGLRGPDVRRRGTGYPHPCGARSVSLEPSLGYPSGSRLLANRARFDLFSYKVSQNGQVSSEYVEKASVSPYFQKRVGKSPLGFLRFPFLPAFSPKELMGLFEPEARFIVKMTKCRPVVHTSVPAKCTVRYPHGSRGKPLLGPAPHLT